MLKAGAPDAADLGQQDKTAAIKAFGTIRKVRAYLKGIGIEYPQIMS